MERERKYGETKRGVKKESRNGTGGKAEGEKNGRK